MYLSALIERKLRKLHMDDLLSRIAWMYYNTEMTQKEIAQRLGLSRIKVLRLLKQAREKGIVEIKIKIPEQNFFDLENKVREKFNLRDALVIPDFEDEESLYHALAHNGAIYVQNLLSEGQNVGIGLSKTLYYLQKYIEPDESLGCNFYSLTGGLTQVPDEYEHTNVIANLASAFGGTAYSILAPIFVSGPAIKAMLSQEKSIGTILNQAKKCDIALTSVGTHEKNSVLFEYTPLDFEEEVDLILNEAVGDVLGRFFNIQGEEIQSKLSDITIGLSINELKAIPTVILIAGGERKQKAIQGALNGYIADVLITNRNSAERLLQ